MEDVRDLIQKLEWGTPEKEKESAIRKLQFIDDVDLHLLLQPFSKAHWDGAAEVIINLGYPRVKNILPGLLIWLQDLNWPGARQISIFLNEVGDPIIPYHPAYINIKDDYFYYSDGWKLTKVKIDGSDKQILANSAFHVYVKGEYIYFTNNGPQDGFIFKMKTDGSEKKQVNNDHASQIAVSGDTIYYTSYYNKLIRVDLDGQSKKKLLTGKLINDINVDGDWIYFNYNQKLYKMKIDGTELTKLSNDNPRYINVNGDWIYYSDFSTKQNLVRIKKDGSSREEMNQIKSWYISIVDQYLFYHDMSKIVKIDIDKIESEMK